MRGFNVRESWDIHAGRKFLTARFRDVQAQTKKGSGLPGSAVVPTARPPQKIFFGNRQPHLPTLNVTAHLKTLSCYREKFIAHPAANLRATRS